MKNPIKNPRKISCDFSWPLQSNAVRQVDAQQLELRDQVRSA